MESISESHKQPVSAGGVINVVGGGGGSGGSGGGGARSEQGGGVVGIGAGKDTATAVGSPPALPFGRLLFVFALVCFIMANNSTTTM